ncbi:MAG: sulfotransferase domain-containing protein [Rhodobacter sp.]|nr:sulfotransferase domain-containing protein [Rhodobacter sp.]
MSEPHRYIIIIGAMKSGTTTLFDVLARHPAIAPASYKEPGFFAFDDVWAQGFDWFDTLFDFDPARHRYRLEASTDYTKAPFVTGVWDRMTARPDVDLKLLYIVRDPLKRLESHARHTERNRREIGRQVSPRPSHSFDAGISPVSLAISAYASQLDQYAEARAQGRLHVLTLEALQADPDAALAPVWAFLGLDPLALEGTLQASNAAGSQTRVHPLWAALTGIRPLLAAGKAVLPGGLRQALRQRFRKRAVEVTGRFRLDPAETAFLEDFYKADHDRLRTDYGVDTSLWN